MKAIKTGAGVAMARSIMMLYPKEKRLFEDPYSEKLLPPFYKFYLLDFGKITIKYQGKGLSR